MDCWKSGRKTVYWDRQDCRPDRHGSCRREASLRASMRCGNSTHPALPFIKIYDSRSERRVSPVRNSDWSCLRDFEHRKHVRASPEMGLCFEAKLRLCRVVFGFVVAESHLHVRHGFARSCFARLKAPLFYKQKRVGRDGRLFEIFKFRTMCAGADKNGPSVTSSDDVRITAVGPGCLRVSQARRDPAVDQRACAAT